MKTSKTPINITVIGPGRWGSFLACYISNIGHNTVLYGLKEAPEMQRFLADRRSSLVELPDALALSTDLESSVDRADIIVISINSQGLRGLMKEIAALNVKNKAFVLCMKGIEVSTGKRLTEVVSEYIDPSCSVAVWLGPGHVQDFCAGIPNCMVVDSENKELKSRLVDAFSSNLIRIYYGDDLIGNEIGGAAKNVIGIAAGMLDGYGVSSLKGPLMARGAREISRLMKAMGANELSAYGLCHLGDYEATVFSAHSHNRAFGEAFIKGEKFEALAEGYYTVCALMSLAEKYEVDLPICRAVYALLYENADPKNALSELFGREFKREFY